MDPHVTQWLNLAIRWIHVITGIAWIGTSFYFNWLNSRITTPERPEQGVDGELWSVHAGGFYRTVKYAVAPDRLPRRLHWFKWEAYATWISGFALLVLIYYLEADLFLVDSSVADITPGLGIATGLGTLAVSWLVYDLLCKSPLGKTTVPFTTVAFLLAAGVAWSLSNVLSPRGAYIHVGVMLGTLMTANVFRVIIPSQREMVTAMVEGRSPNAALGKQAALRSLHNNYMTLPVLFIMVSNHYPETYGHELNWLILAAIAVIGAGTRHYFNLRNKGYRNVWILPAAAVGIIALGVVTQPRSGSQTGDTAASFAEVRVVIAQRCATCHSSAPTDASYTVAPGDVILDTPEQIRAQANRIHAVTVATQTMPLGNVTSMTQEERDILGSWIRDGARIR